MMPSSGGDVSGAAVGESERRAPEVDWIARLRDLRRLMGWSQRKLARELRVTSGAVSQWESGRRAIPGPVKRVVELYEHNLGMVEPPGRVGKVEGSWAGRTLRVSTTTARLGARLAGSSLRSLVVGNARATEIKRATQQAIAQELGETLADLKGLATKIGQMASYLDFAAPQSVRQMLQPLQDATSTMDEAVVEAVFRASLGDTPARIFRRWEARPFAAASIGQVHRAELADGSRVAVKVQYPGIRQTVEADLQSLSVLDKLSAVVFRAPVREALLAELREKLLEECDYVREADAQETFRELFAANPRVVIPRVYRDWSTERILTSQYVDGRRFAAFARQADQASKDRAGELIFRFASGSLLRHRIFNADPHPGNYLFLEDGAVAFLDFGCVKRFSRDFVRRWTRYLQALAAGRRAEADALVVELGFVEDRERFDFDYHHEAVMQVFEFWLSDAPFRFNGHYVERNWRALWVENPNKARLRMPPDFLFLNRLQFGLHSVLAALGAQADWRAIFLENLAHAAA